MSRVLRIRTALAAPAVVVAAGTLGYVLLGLTPLDALYQTITTITRAALLLAVRRPGRPFEANPDPDILVEEGSVLIALGTADELTTLRRRVDAT